MDGLKINVAVFLVLFSFCSCGPVQSLPSRKAVDDAEGEGDIDRLTVEDPGLSIPRSPAVGLGLQIRFGKTAELSQEDTEVAQTRSDGQISFAQAIPLVLHPHGNPLIRQNVFFVWSGNAFASPIVGATYRYGILNVRNQKIAKAASRLANYTATTDRWYISVADVLSHAAVDRQEFNTQIITLILQLADLTTHEIEIKFRLQLILEGQTDVI